MTPTALTIAGSDPSGGAGLQADLKTFHQHGVYGMAAVTLLTVQNTQRVSRVEVMNAELVREQIVAVVEDIAPRAAKTGALGNAAVVRVVAECARAFQFPLVVDPVMISKHGHRLVADDAIDALKRELLPRTFLVTPNVPEAEVLTGLTIRTVDNAERAARVLLELGCTAALVKGGHLEGAAIDVLAYQGRVERFAAERIATPHTHGTGCTLSASITARLARGEPLERAVSGAKRWLLEALRSAPGLGRGIGPLNHFAPLS